jgi:hypothetical protein
MSIGEATVATSAPIDVMSPVSESIASIEIVLAPVLAV